MKRFLVLLSLIFIIPNLAVADDLKKKVLTLRDRSEIRNRLLKDRFESVLPDIMERTGIDMWIIVAREYNEDPVIKTMLPATWLNARRRTILVVYNPGSGNKLETYAIARYDVGEVFKRMWDPEQQPDQYKALAKLIYDKNPNKIGYFKIEILNAYSPLYFDHKQKLSCITSAMNLIKILTAEHQSNSKVYFIIQNLFLILREKDWLKKYIFWELELLKLLGYDLELENLVTKDIVNNETVYYANSSNEKKYVPNFLVERDLEVNDDKILLNGLKLVSDYLDKTILKPNNINYPNSRLLFINSFK